MKELQCKSYNYNDMTRKDTEQISTFSREEASEEGKSKAKRDAVQQNHDSPLYINSKNEIYHCILKEVPSGFDLRISVPTYFCSSLYLLSREGMM